MSNHFDLAILFRCSLVLGSCPTEKSRTSLFPQLLFRAAPLGFVAALIFNALLTFVY
ncbi:hypothetical protein [Pseudomonas sp. SST3]|uniref:hypothetical protein n=1 Tax=Pseudomonas sp. SST3 TaxID=2267882 RepID=UPI001F5140FE|nr:hypothetical protein [Pseudomonas sp. SST3]